MVARAHFPPFTTVDQPTKELMIRDLEDTIRYYQNQLEYYTARLNEFKQKEYNESSTKVN